MIRAELDPCRWRKRFAWRPRKLGTQWIWLEWYAFRPLKSEEVAPLLEALYSIGPLRCSFWEEFTIKRSGYTVWRETGSYVGMGMAARFWHRPPLKLSIVANNPTLTGLIHRSPK